MDIHGQPHYTTVSAVNGDTYTTLNTSGGYVNGKTVGLIYDADAAEIRWTYDGVDQGIVFSSVPAGTYIFASTTGDYHADYNFGQKAFVYQGAGISGLVEVRP